MTKFTTQVLKNDWTTYAMDRRGFGLAYPDGAIDELERLVEAGDYEATIVTLLADAMEMADDEIEAFRSNIAKTTNAALAAVPGSQVTMLAGHRHFAHKSDPHTVAALVHQFTTQGGQ